MKINIAISAFNRPEYSLRSLAAIFGAKGFSRNKYNIFCAMDCYSDGSINQEVFDVYSSFGITPLVATKKQGCNYTVKAALELAWAGNPDFVLMIEDDIIISHDALLYIEWAAEKFMSDTSYRTVGLWKSKNGWAFDKPISYQTLFEVNEQVNFTCWGWGTWRDRWDEMRDNWTTGDDSHDTSWDVILFSHLNNRKETVPSISRAYNCGELNGTHRGRDWPGITSTGIIDPDGPIDYWFKKEL